MQPASDRSVIDLLTDLRDQLAKLLRLEFRLARAEFTEMAADALRGIAVMAAACVVGAGALLALLGAATVAVQSVFMALGAPSRASLIFALLLIAAAATALALAMLRHGRAMLSALRPGSTRTAESLRDASELLHGDDDDGG